MDARTKILIVEDDDDTRYGLRVRLRAGGYETVTAPNAFYALRVARWELPDLVILDLGLPDGSGFDVLRAMREHPQLEAVPVVIVTATDAHVGAERARRGGACAFLQKPVDTRALRETLATALAGAGNGGARAASDGKACAASS